MQPSCGVLRDQERPQHGRERARLNGRAGGRRDRFRGHIRLLARDAALLDAEVRGVAGRVDARGVPDTGVEPRLTRFRLMRGRQDHRGARGQRERASEGDGVLGAVRAVDADEDLGHVVPRFRRRSDHRAGTRSRSSGQDCSFLGPTPLGRRARCLDP
jgi:hypothetical protein